MAFSGKPRNRADNVGRSWLGFKIAHVAPRMAEAMLTSCSMIRCAASSMPSKVWVIAIESVAGCVAIMILLLFSLLRYVSIYSGDCNGEHQMDTSGRSCPSTIDKYRRGASWYLRQDWWCLLMYYLVD